MSQRTLPCSKCGKPITFTPGPGLWGGALATKVAHDTCPPKRPTLSLRY